MDPQKRWDLNAYAYDRWTTPMEQMGGRRWREMLFSELPAGRILELGVGTGANIDYYPRTDRTYVGIDISPKMLERARARSDRLHVPVELLAMDAQHLDFSDGTFDAVVATFVFCSVPDPVQALLEARRVLNKKGLALFLEHMRPQGKLSGRISDILNPLFLKLMGVSINRRTVANINAAGFKIMAEKQLWGDIFKLIKARP